MNNLFKDDIYYSELGSDCHSQMIFSQFYTELLEFTFPNKNERESLETVLERNRTQNEKVRSSKAYTFYNRNGKIIAGLIFSYLEELSCMAIEFIVVDEEYRRRGLATEILHFVIARVKHTSELDYIVIEIEHPTVISDGNFSYLHFWMKMNMKVIDLKYIQPALKGGDSPVESLMLCVKCLSNDSMETISTDFVKRFIVLYATHACWIENAECDSSILRMTGELDKRINDLKLIALTN